MDCRFLLFLDPQAVILTLVLVMKTGLSPNSSNSPAYLETSIDEGAGRFYLYNVFERRRFRVYLFRFVCKMHAPTFYGIQNI